LVTDFADIFTPQKFEDTGGFPWFEISFFWLKPVFVANENGGAGNLGTNFPRR
jgi:hypothetical protein